MRTVTESGTAGKRIADGVIETLALSEAELIERIASLEADVTVYRELAQAGIAALHQLTIERDQYRCRVFALVDENRAQRLELQHVAAQTRALQHQDVAA